MENEKSMRNEIKVKNAGLVLLSPFFPRLFELLGIIKNHKFINESAQIDAVHYLQFASIGLTQSEEESLPLNNVLCGLPSSHPVKKGQPVLAEQMELINNMIKAVIQNWSKLGSTSITVLRESFLLREGLLIEFEDRFELKVERESSLDILIDHIPWSFSIIKLPWMEKPIHVMW